MIVLQSKTAWLLMGAVVITSSILAQAPNKTYSLSELVDSARQNYPVLLQKQAQLEAAKAGITDARHAFLPTAVIGDEVLIGTDNSLPGSYISFGIIPSTSSGVRKENSFQSATGNIAALYTQYDLINFGLRDSKIQNATAYAGLSQADLDKELYLLKWQIGKVYFELLKSQYQLGVDQENINRYQKIYSVIQAVTISGIRPGVDSSLALAELSKTRINYNQTLGSIRQLQQQLHFLTGVPIGSISIDTAAVMSSFPVIQATNRFGDTLLNPLTEYYFRQKSVYASLETVIKKSYLPKVILTGTTWARGSSIDYNGDYLPLQNGLGYQRANYLAGVAIVYDLFNGVHRKDKLLISKYNTAASDYQLQQQKRTMDNISSQAVEAIRTSEQNLAESPIQVHASRDAFDQNTAQYKAGIINLVDLTNASFVLYRSQLDYVQTLTGWLVANLDKAAASGNLDLFIQSLKK